MTTLSKLKLLGGSAGGMAIYFAAKAATVSANSRKPKKKLSTNTKKKLRRLFPDLDLDRVRVKYRCSLPGNWFSSRKTTEAMTFGYTIYCRHKSMQGSASRRNLLIHELVHVDQVRKRGDSESRFARDYGKGYLEGGGYIGNPLEVEAFEFADNNE